MQAAMSAHALLPRVPRPARGKIRSSGAPEASSECAACSMHCKIAPPAAQQLARPCLDGATFAACFQHTWRQGGRPSGTRSRGGQLQALEVEVVLDGEGEEFDIQLLERYTEMVPKEVLIVNAEVDGEEDQVLVYKGYSSSLVNPTAFDPSVPVLPPNARVRSIDRMRAPYSASSTAIAEGLSWGQMRELLISTGLLA